MVTVTVSGKLVLIIFLSIGAALSYARKHNARRDGSKVFPQERER